VGPIIPTGRLIKSMIEGMAFQEEKPRRLSAQQV